MPSLTTLLTPLALLNIIEIQSNNLQTMFQNNPDFKNWYYENYHKSPLPEEAYNKFTQYVEQRNKGVIEQTFRLKMDMIKHGWNDSFFENEPKRLKQLAYDKHLNHDISPTRLAHFKAIIDTDFLQMIGEEDKQYYMNALQTRSQYLQLVSDTS
jgi:hypothetical protein